MGKNSAEVNNNFNNLSVWIVILAICVYYLYPINGSLHVRLQ